MRKTPNAVNTREKGRKGERERGRDEGGTVEGGREQGRKGRKGWEKG